MPGGKSKRTRCEGLPGEAGQDGPSCPYPELETKYCQGGLELCKHCEEIRFPIGNAISSTQLINDNTNSPFVKESSKVVICEVLSFVSEKLNHLPNDVVVQICTSFYDEKTLLKASEVLNEICNLFGGRNERYKKRQGPSAKANIVKDIVAMFQKHDNLEVKFVAADLNNIPPVGFQNIDVCALLSKVENSILEMEILKKTMIAMEQQMKIQQEVSKGLANIRCCNTPPAEDNNNPVIELSANQTANTMNASRKQKAVIQKTAENAKDREEKYKRMYPALSQLDDNWNHEYHSLSEGTAIVQNNITNVVSGSSTYAQKTQGTERNGRTEAFQIVERKKGKSVKPSYQIANGDNKKKRFSVIGKAKDIPFNAIKAKRLANVFVSRLDATLDEKELKNYIDSKLNVEAKVEIARKTEWYSSFHITCYCEDPTSFMNPDIWPEGAYLRWWKNTSTNDKGKMIQNSLTPLC